MCLHGGTYGLLLIDGLHIQFLIFGSKILHDTVPHAQYGNDGPIIRAIDRGDPPFALRIASYETSVSVQNPSSRTSPTLAKAFSRCWDKDVAKRPPVQYVVDTIMSVLQAHGAASPVPGSIDIGEEANESQHVSPSTVLEPAERKWGIFKTLNFRRNRSSGAPQ